MDILSTVGGINLWHIKNKNEARNLSKNVSSRQFNKLIHPEILFPQMGMKIEGKRGLNMNISNNSNTCVVVIMHVKYIHQHQKCIIKYL